MHDDQFTATGPAHHTSGVKQTAFSTAGPGNFLCGVSVVAARCGVVGEGLQNSADGPEGSSSLPGVGVEGFGVSAGVVGTGRRDAIASVFGQANRCKVGVLGAVMNRQPDAHRGIGVAGVSVRNMGNPLENFNTVEDHADGAGIGVLGASGAGPGVRGSSEGGSGGDFKSTNGPGVTANSLSGPGVNAQSFGGVGVRAASDSDRGGVFQSGRNVAQIHLVPLEQQAGDPELPKSGQVGDLLLIRNSVVMNSGTHQVIHDKCSLWLCVPSGGTSLITGTAMWQEVQLGNVVAGAI